VFGLLAARGCADAIKAGYWSRLLLLVTRAGRLTRTGGRHVLRVAHNPATEALRMRPSTTAWPRTLFSDWG